MTDGHDREHPEVPDGTDSGDLPTAPVARPGEDDEGVADEGGPTDPQHPTG